MESTGTGCLLRKESYGENNILLVFFLEDSGLVSVLTRKSKSGKPGQALPDLFETGLITFNVKQDGKFGFLKDYEPESRRLGIASSYERLKAAASLVRFLELNLLHMESFHAAWEVLSVSLDALADKPHPNVTLMKALFLIARSEGYAVHSRWLASFQPSVRADITHALQSPLESIDSGDKEVTGWISNMYAYFARETDLLSPEQRATP